MRTSNHFVSRLLAIRGVRRPFGGDGEAVEVDSLVRVVKIDLSDMVNELKLVRGGQENRPERERRLSFLA